MLMLPGQASAQVPDHRIGNALVRMFDYVLSQFEQASTNGSLADSLEFLGPSVLGIVVALHLRRSNTTFRDPKQVSRQLGVDIIGALPHVAGRIRLGSTRRESAPSSRGQRRFLAEVASYHEAMRSVQSCILRERSSRRIRSVLIASPGTGEGKSTTAIHLAVAHAERGYRTLIIDADILRPVVQKRLNVDTYVGLSDILEGHMHWTQAVKPVEVHRNLDLIASGGRLQQPSKHLLDKPISLLLRQVTAVYDLVVIDTPSTLGLAEVTQIARHAEGVILIAHAGQTSQAVGAAIVSLRQVHANVVGVVLNRCRTHKFQFL